MASLVLLSVQEQWFCPRHCIRLRYPFMNLLSHQQKPKTQPTSAVNSRTKDLAWRRPQISNLCDGETSSTRSSSIHRVTYPSNLIPSMRHLSPKNMTRIPSIVRLFPEYKRSVPESRIDSRSGFIERNCGRELLLVYSMLSSSNAMGAIDDFGV